MDLHGLLDELTAGHAKHNSISLKGLLDLVGGLVHHIDPRPAEQAAVAAITAEAEKEALHGIESVAGEITDKINGGGQSADRRDTGEAGRFGFLETGSREAVNDERHEAGQNGGEQPESGREQPESDGPAGPAGPADDHALAQWEGDGGKAIPADV